MTSRTLAGKAGMVHSGRFKGDKIVVASIAGCRRRNVISHFALGIGTVVTIGTCARKHSRMRVGRRGPCRRTVTVATRVGGLNMDCRLG